MKEKFINFLKDKGAYKSYVRNFKMLHAMYPGQREESLNEFLERERPRYYFLVAFCWHYTIENRNYWANLANFWYNEI